MAHLATALPGPDTKRYTITAPWIALNTALGEGPFFDAANNILRFVDIVHCKLYQVDLSKGPDSLTTFSLGMSVSTTAEIKGHSDQFVFGGKAGVGLMDRRTGEWRYLVKYWPDDAAKEKRFRGNDGAVDARGRFFVGTMTDPVELGKIESGGTLFRVDPDLKLHTVKHPVTIPNGISWTKDNKWIYFTESTDNAITKYPYDLDTGAIDFENGEVFFQCPYKGGVPDGHARDADGCFWVACYGVGKVVRVDESGQIIAEVTLPARCVSCPVICGEDLYIVTAEEAEPEKYPESAKDQSA